MSQLPLRCPWAMWLGSRQWNMEKLSCHSESGLNHKSHEYSVLYLPFHVGSWGGVEYRQEEPRHQPTIAWKRAACWSKRSLWTLCEQFSIYQSYIYFLGLFVLAFSVILTNTRNEDRTSRGSNLRDLNGEGETMQQGLYSRRKVLSYQGVQEVERDSGMLGWGRAEV